MHPVEIIGIFNPAFCKNLTRIKLASFLAIYLCSVGCPVFSEENNFSDILKITITGTKSEKNIKDYAGSVNVIDKIDFDQSPSVDIRNLFKNIPGVTTTFSTRSGVRGTPGITDVNIRGLDGDQILFLIDGIRLPERYEYGRYYNLGKANYIDFCTLKRVEIIKGSASSLYGSDAFGGLISYTSLTPDDILKEDSDFNIEIPINYTSENTGYTTCTKTALKLADNISSLFIYSKEQSNESQVLTKPKYLDEASNTGNNYFINTQFDINEYSKVNVIYDNLARESRINSSQGNLELMSTFFNYQSLISNTNTYRSRISSQYSYENPYNALIEAANFSIFRQDARQEDNFRRELLNPADMLVSEQNYYDLNSDILGAYANLKSTFSIFEADHLISYGFDVSESNGSRTRTKIDITNGNRESSKDTPDTSIFRGGIYVQDQFPVLGLNVVAGIRYDNYKLDAKNDDIYNLSQGSKEPVGDQSYDVFTPSLSISFSPSDSSTIYARYSQGFRAPTWYEVNSSFSNPSFGYATVSNPDLKPETSHSYEIGTKLNFDQFDSTFAVYYNHYSDLIEAFTPIGVVDGLTLYMTQNISEAEIYGVELFAKYYFNPNREGFFVSNVLAWSEGNDLTTNIPLDTIVPFTNRFTVGYSGYLNLWTVSAGLVYVGSARLPDLYEYFIPPAYLIADLTANFQINESISINASINNLTDQRYYNLQDVRGRLATAPDITKYSYPERNYQIGIRFWF